VIEDPPFEVEGQRAQRRRDRGRQQDPAAGHVHRQAVVPDGAQHRRGGLAERRVVDAQPLQALAARRVVEGHEQLVRGGEAPAVGTA
jgi:hypothetical protein